MVFFIIAATDLLKATPNSSMSPPTLGAPVIVASLVVYSIAYLSHSFTLQEVTRPCFFAVQDQPPQVTKRLKYLLSLLLMVKDDNYLVNRLIPATFIDNINNMPKELNFRRVNNYSSKVEDMGRSEPCILFAQSFIHSQLDEYVDEVIFAEPVVITACEFLEQNASPSAPNVPLIGATSPPSFALEIFVLCEGESRFRRLCHPFLYSHSASNVLEVEAIVTNHLVVRGSYRSLTLIVYGNTAEDLGQFNIEFDLDSSLANVVCSPCEGKLEDLPLALHSNKLLFEESVASLKTITSPIAKFEVSSDLKQFVLLAVKIGQNPDTENRLSGIVSNVVSSVISCGINESSGATFFWDQNMEVGITGQKEDLMKVCNALAHARKGLHELCTSISDNWSVEGLADLEIAETLIAELLIDMYNKGNSLNCTLLYRYMILVLGLTLLFCSWREGCSHFVKSGGMERIVCLLGHETRNSPAITLMLLGVIECATRHGIGCEGFLGWWPRGNDNAPAGNSDGYSYLLRLLLGKQRHDVASLASYVLHRLRFYEIVARYESAALFLMDSPSGDKIESLVNASSYLKQIMRLVDHYKPIEDPSPVSFAQKLSTLGQAEGLLSYKSTVDRITTSKCSFARWDIDPSLLSLLEERGFFPLSAALLSCPLLHSADGNRTGIFMDIASSIEYILLNFLFHRSGLCFLLTHPEATELLILCLNGVEESTRKECMTLRQATVLLSKGFLCYPQEVAMLTELHLKVAIAVDRLLATDSQSDELLWTLWELCAISRSDAGRPALLILGHFPEVVSVLLDALRSYKDIEPTDKKYGTSPLSLAIFHSAAEIFEIIVTDSAASSLGSWIRHAVELHKALHLSSPGTNRKDAPTRLLEWIDAGVVYHRNGAIGLLRYAAVLASGGDAQLSSTSVLVSDSIDVENVIGDSTNNSDVQIVDNLLGKLVLDKYFDGVTLPNSSVVQLTTTFRIFAFISDDPAVAASLFEEGAVALIYVVLVSCKSMFERLSNSYDYLVDDGAEYNSTTDILLERSHEQNLIDLMIPCLLFLINLLKNLREAKDQYRNKKLLNALLQLHREVSLKLAAYAADLSFPYPSSTFGFGAVCHLLTSALACWPIFGWTPGLFHCILESVQANLSLALGPKDACSIFCLLGDLFPDEGIWSWKDEMPPLSALRTLSVGSLLGPLVEKDINWYLQPEHLKLLLIRLTPQLDRIAQIALHFAFSSLLVVQDMLRVFIIRIACQRAECAIVLLRPIISWMDNHVDENSPSPSEMDTYKVYQLLQFIASLLEHPRAKPILLTMGALTMMRKVLVRCSGTYKIDGKLTLENRVPPKSISLHSWSFPALKSVALVFSSWSQEEQILTHERELDDTSIGECSSILYQILVLLQVLPIGKELLACLVSLMEVVSCCRGRSALASLFSQISDVFDKQKQDERIGSSNNFDWCGLRSSPPFLCCLRNLLCSLDANICSVGMVVQVFYTLSLCATRLSVQDDKLDGFLILKCLFGLSHDGNHAEASLDEQLKILYDIIEQLEQIIANDDFTAVSVGNPALYQFKQSAKSMLILLQSPSSPSSKPQAAVCNDNPSIPCDNVHIPSHKMPSLAGMSENDEVALSLSDFWKLNRDAMGISNDLSIGEFADKFVWECPDSSLDRQMMPTLPARRKLALPEGSSKRARDSLGPETVASGAFSRGLSIASASSGPTRRDTFRQRKPNTSRPPSMHVDDYVARERNNDGASSGPSMVSSSQRGLSTSGRPPSIHVDEFMARQKERLNCFTATAGDISQFKNVSQDNPNYSAKLDKQQQMKTDPDDDLQEINIIFDEESESDDKLPFPQPDENLCPPVVIGESSPSLVAADTEGDAEETTRFSPLDAPSATTNGSLQTSIALRQFTSRSKIRVPQEVNASSENFSGTVGDDSSREQSEESKYISPNAGSRVSIGHPSTKLVGFTSHTLNSSPASSAVQLLPPSLYQNSSPHRGADGSVSSGSHDKLRVQMNQPPLPPMPPPGSAQAAEPVQNHSLPFVNSARDMQPPVPSGYPPRTFDLQSDNAPSTSYSSFSNVQPGPSSKFPWNMMSGGRLHTDMFTSSTSARPVPPLPPMPPPFSAAVNQSTTIPSATQASMSHQITNIGAQTSATPTPLSNTSFGVLSASGTNLTSYSLPPFSPSMFINRPASVPGTFLSSPALQNVQNPSNFSQAFSSSQSPLQSVLPRLPPPQPQLPRPTQQPAPSNQVSQTLSDLAMPFQQNPIHVQVNPLQVTQQLQVPQLQFYYQTQQQEPVLQAMQPKREQAQQPTQNPQGDNSSVQQKDSGMTLQQYFSSPEAIQSLLSDRDKLCQLLEQHPKLMQMLQERLGQQ